MNFTEYWQIPDERAAIIDTLTREEIEYVGHILHVNDMMDDIADIITDGKLAKEEPLVEKILPEDYDEIVNTYDEIIYEMLSQACKNPEEYNAPSDDINYDLLVELIIAYATDIYGDGEEYEWQYMFPENGPGWKIERTTNGAMRVVATQGKEGAIYQNDYDAAVAASEAGVPIAEVKNLPLNLPDRTYGWIDLPENISALQALANKTSWPIYGKTWNVEKSLETGILRIIPNDEDVPHKQAVKDASDKGVPVIAPGDLPEGYWGYGYVNTPQNIELMKEIAAKKITPGRNEPCPCGSGKKYKKCCGSK